MTDWNQQIIDEFRANEGRVGGMFEGAPMILIHHVGAKTGTERVSPLVYFPEDDGKMVIVASKGGAPENPAWYHNLKANPKIDVEVGTRDVPRPRGGDHGRGARRGLAAGDHRAVRLRRVPAEDQPHDPRAAAHSGGLIVSTGRIVPEINVDPEDP